MKDLSAYRRLLAALLVLLPAFAVFAGVRLVEDGGRFVLDNHLLSAGVDVSRGGDAVWFSSGSSSAVFRRGGSLPMVFGESGEWGDSTNLFANLAANPVSVKTSFNKDFSRSVWFGETLERGDLRWTRGFTMSPDRAMLKVEDVVSNLSTAKVEGVFRFPEPTSKKGMNHLAMPCGNDVYAVRVWDGASHVPPVIGPKSCAKFTGWWYVVAGIGGVRAATVDGAVNLRLVGDSLTIGFHSTVSLNGCVVLLCRNGKPFFSEGSVAISPAKCWRREVKVPADAKEEEFTLKLLKGDGTAVLAYPLEPPQTPPVPSIQAGPFSGTLVVQAHELRMKGDNRLCSKTLRKALAVDALDAWAVAERVFLEDDGEGAAAKCAEGRGDAKRELAAVIKLYSEIGAKKEADMLRKQLEGVQ